MKFSMSRIGAAFEQRSQLEKALLGILVLVVIAWLLVSYLYLPLAQEAAAAQRRLANTEARVEALVLREQAAIRARQQDPDAPARQRLSAALQMQETTSERIELLAANLVSPTTMTHLLTGMLDGDNTSLRLLRVENREPQPLREANDEDGGEVQVYRHSLVLELEGDYLGLLAYLRRVETLGMVFFWDRLQYVQTEWPSGRATLELHTLSSEAGFVGG